MVTHEEALNAALDGWYETDVPHTDYDRSGMEAAIRAYLDARGLVMVPKEPTLKMAEASQLARMNIAGGYGGPSSWEAMLAAAPDPFGDAP